ncbi:MAG TPA: sialate O-acetylesterase [Luteolibacter sp.]|nr:sialate O-acetylesterase [Luteolibacter sp.]
MKQNHQARRAFALSSIALAAFAVSPYAAVAAEKAPIPKPDGKPADMSKPVQVFILMGQSNMVGMGAITGGSSRWGKEFLEPVVSVYPGPYDPKADYDAMKPEKTVALGSVGGTEPSPYPGGGTQVLRGFIQPAQSGLYEFNPGYGASEQNIMVVNGVEVHRLEPGGKAVKKSVKLTAGEKVPFKITYLTENADGLGWMTRMDIPGALNTLVRYEGKYPYLVDDTGAWSERKDVRFVRYMSGSGPLNNEWLGIKAGTIGPEHGIGHVVGNAIDAPVMLLKCCIGNRSLGWDLLPPGSERFVEGDKVYAGYKDRPDSWPVDPAKGTATEPQPWVDKNGKPINWYAGLQWDLDTGDAKKALADLAKHYPDATKYEVAGFFFWQGEKDGGSPVHAAHYEKNLTAFIKALRKEFNAPNAKFVLGTMGEAVKGSGDKVMEGQLAVDGASGKHPEFKGNVATVYTNPMAQGGSGNGHYGRNAEVYMDVGEAMGKAMVELLGKE